MKADAISQSAICRAARMATWADERGRADTLCVQSRPALLGDRWRALAGRLQRRRPATGLLTSRGSAGWIAHEPTTLERVLTYSCNICGTSTRAAVKSLAREGSTCRRCHSSVRWRSLIDLLSRALFGESLPISSFPTNLKTGIGISDDNAYAGRLARKLAYINTFYHQAPKLDLCVPDGALRGSCDFVIASDVLEHVQSPVSRALDGIYSMLRPGGVLIGSVPYALEVETTIEHFPKLHRWQIGLRDGVHVLHNRREDGTEEVFEDLVFHGGPGATLEMRLFSQASLTADLQAAGFTHVQYCDHDVPEWGIVWLHPWSIPFVATK